MRHRYFPALSLLAVAATLLLAGCASAPVPDWHTNAFAAHERAFAAHLQGKSSQAEREWRKARAAISASARLDMLARLELAACAARTAGLEFGACAAYEALAQDAGAQEAAYARYLHAAPQPYDLALLPAAHRATAALLAAPATAATPEAAHATVSAIADPAARLIAAAVLLRAGLGSQALAQLAADAASAQGWRRPLLAWLRLLARDSDPEAAARAARRIRTIESEGRPAEQ